MNEKVDVVIFGSGFAGSIMGSILRRLGRSVLIIEKTRHPRFAIGESSTPLANLLLEQLAGEYNLPHLKQLSSWGLWQKHFPQIPCGLKRGFTFVQHVEGKAYSELPHPKSLLVAASPSNEIADTHWYRPALDSFLVAKAAELGVMVIEETSVSSLRREDGKWGIIAQKGCKRIAIEAQFLMDATGAHGMLSHLFRLGEMPFEHLEQRWSVFSHFKNVAPFEHFTATQTILAGYEGNDSALHHIFDGGWIWVLRFNHGIVSAGAVLNQAWQEKIQSTDPAAAWAEVLGKFPEIQRQFKSAVAVEPFRRISGVSYRSAEIVGEGWAMLPSAASFVDPLLSSGFPLALLGVERLARLFKHEQTPSILSLRQYQCETFLESEVTEMLIAAMFKAFKKLPDLIQLSLLYFAAASYSETMQRLRPSRPKAGFLLVKNAAFSSALVRICSRYLNNAYEQASSGELENEVKEAIEPFDVAGLSRRNESGCYPVNFQDLYRAQGKLDVHEKELDAMVALIRLEIESLRQGS